VVALQPCAVAAQAPTSACQGLPEVFKVEEFGDCVEELREHSTEAQGRALKKNLGALKEIREACPAANEKSSMWGCKGMSDLAHQVFARGLSLLRTCQKDPPADCDERGKGVAWELLELWQITGERFQNTPADSLVTKRLEVLQPELFGPLGSDQRIGEGDEALPPAWNVSMRAVERLQRWISGFVWRETHWLWLMDSLQAGRVVQTTWGDADEWTERFGENDAKSDAPLVGQPPRYIFSEKLGMRWQVLVELLHELRERRGGGELQVVEIGVFAGHLSHFLLRDCPFIKLLGIDPYVGSDGTFPGNFSKTLDADVALYKAASVMESYGERGQLWPTTSEVATAEIQDGSVDAVFVDGCHLYDCVRQDLELWLPKMRRGVPVLVSGHDFSPQWPGVVRAVHEQRVNGGEVYLASDWMWWWWEEYA